MAERDGPLTPSSAWMTPEGGGGLGGTNGLSLWWVVSAGLVILAAFSVLVVRDRSDDGPSRRQRRAYQECMYPYLPQPSDYRDPVEGRTYPTVTATPAQVRACEAKLSE